MLPAVARIKWLPLSNKLKKDVSRILPPQLCLYCSRMTELLTLREWAQTLFRERSFPPLASMILFFKSLTTDCRYRWGLWRQIDQEINNFTFMLWHTVCIIEDAVNQLPVLLLCQPFQYNACSTSPGSRKSCCFVPVIKSCSCKDHGVLIGPLGSVAPAWSGTIPVVAPCWITNNTLWKTSPYSEGKIHLVKQKGRKEGVE